MVLTYMPLRCRSSCVEESGTYSAVENATVDLRNVRLYRYGERSMLRVNNVTICLKDIRHGVFMIRQT